MATDSEARSALAGTVGAAEPRQLAAVLDPLVRQVSPTCLGLHLHDDGRSFRGKLDAALQRGIRRYDAAVGGLGGCPFAPAAVRNLDAVALTQHLERSGYRTGIDARRLAAAGAYIRERIGLSGGRSHAA